MKKVLYVLSLLLLLINSLLVQVTTAFAYGTYQAATNAVGQLGGSGPLYTQSAANGGTNKYGQSAPNGTAVDVAGHRLFVADTSNNRVLVYTLSSSNSLVEYSADAVLGQWNYLDSAAATSPTGLNTPTGLFYNAGNNYLYVADSGNNRVMIYDVSSISNGESAVAVLGQTTFYLATAATTQSGLRNPRGVTYDSANSLLFVADTDNHRVLVYNLSSISNGENAVNIIGQAAFDSSSASVSAKKLSSPLGVTYNAVTRYLYIADTGNNRVMVFDVTTLSDYPTGINVLGQSDITESNSSGNGAGNLSAPSSLAYDTNHTYLYVTDTGNNRILAYDLSSISNGESAVNVLGQSDYGASSSATTQARLSTPRGVSFDATNNLLFIGDASNNRTIVFDVASISNGENAVNEVGQTNYAANETVYTRSTANNGPRDLGLVSPKDVLVDTIYNRLFVADTDNHRILVYNMSNYALSDYYADYVLGQADFITTTAPSSPSQSNLSNPQGMVLSKYANKLFVSDSDYHRVLVFDVTSITNGENAANILGQSNYTSSATATTQSGFSGPTGLGYDAQNHYLFVADTGNNRVMVFDANSLGNNENAIRVVGQQDYVSGSSGTTSSTMSSPRGAYFDYDDKRLFVTDSGNNRVLVFNFTAITTGEAAVNVLGQANFTANSSGLTQSTLNAPTGLTFETTSQILYVSDTGNNRVMLFAGSTSALTDGENASAVWGYSNYTSNGSVSTTANTFSSPRGVSNNNELHSIWIADSGNNRGLEFDVDSTPSPPYYSGGEAPEFTTLAYGLVLALGFAYIFKKSLAKGQLNI